jgi:hypothetical protein
MIPVNKEHAEQPGSLLYGFFEGYSATNIMEIQPIER